MDDVYVDLEIWLAKFLAVAFVVLAVTIGLGYWLSRSSPRSD